MSTVSLDSASFCHLLGRVAEKLDAHSDELRELDAKVGDGDLGVTATAIAKAFRTFSETADETDMGKLLMKCGMAVSRSNPSTFATLLASGFIESGKAVVGKTSLGLADWVVAGRSAVDGVQKRGKASLGDKSMLDALIPAVEALSAEQDKGGGALAMARAAADAANKGMQATTSMIAKCGRARAFQEKSVGVQDGGATAIFYMFEAFAEFAEESLS